MLDIISRHKKLTIGILGAVIVIVNDVLGKPVSDEAIWSALGILSTYILGQAWADHGAQGAAKAAERAVGKGKDVEAAVRGVLEPRMSNPEIYDDEGPLWDDTSEMDDRDKPSNLFG